ncbi:MAG: DUF72 domain-containing protein [Pyrinomonadaceae bacterium]
MSKRPKIHIGCQSWGYDDWITKAGGEPVFYPRGTKPDEMLRLYSQVFDTIEVDSTVYGMPSVPTIEKWCGQTPENFTFSLKLPREITHEKGLDASSFPGLELFTERVASFGIKLGCVLIQLPARFEADKKNALNLRRFIEHLPAGLRFAVEFRNPGWFTEWTFQELAENNVGLALVEGPWIGRDMVLGSANAVNSGFAYVRLMEERNLEKFDRIYKHKDDSLSLWRKAVNEIAGGDIYIYADNYYEGHAPATANRLKRLLGLTVTEPQILETQGSLF